MNASGIAVTTVLVVVCLGGLAGYLLSSSSGEASMNQMLGKSRRHKRTRKNRRTE